MKLLDCKPGVRVMVYDANYGISKGTISGFEGRMVKVRYDSKDGWDQFYAEQLRKIVPTKDKPSLCVALDKDGSWNSVFAPDKTELIETVKKSGREVWLMRGVKKL